MIEKISEIKTKKIVSKKFEEGSMGNQIALEFEGLNFIEINSLTPEKTIESIRRSIEIISEKIILTEDVEENKSIIRGSAIRTLIHAIRYMECGSSKKLAEIISINKKEKIA